MLFAAVFLGRLENMAVVGGIGLPGARSPYGTIFNSTEMLHFKNHAFVQAWMHGGGSFDFFLELEFNDWDEDFSPHFFTGSVKYMSTPLNLALYHRAYWMIPDSTDPLKLCAGASFNPLDPKAVQGVSMWGAPGWFSYKMSYTRLLKSSEQTLSASVSKYFFPGARLSFESGVVYTSWLYSTGYRNFAGGVYGKFFLHRFSSAGVDLELEYARSTTGGGYSGYVPGYAYLYQVRLRYPGGFVKFFYRDISPQFWVRSSYANFLEINWLATAFSSLSNQKGGGALLYVSDGGKPSRFALRVGYDYYTKKTMYAYSYSQVGFIGLDLSPFSWFSAKYMGWYSGDFSRTFLGMEISPGKFYFRFNIASTFYSGSSFLNFYASVGYRLGGWELRLDYGDNGDPTSDIYGFGVEPYSISASTVDAFAIVLIANF